MPQSHFTIVSLQLAALDAAIALVVLLGHALVRRYRGRDPAINVRGILLASVVMAAACVVKLVCLDRHRWSSFGLMNAVYCETVLGVPLAAIGLLIMAIPLRRKGPLLRATRPAVAVAILGLLPGLAGIYASFIEPYRLIVEQAAVPLAEGRAGSSPLKIGIISDLQTPRVTDHERRAVRLLMQQQPDIVFFAGDLCQGSHADFESQVGAFRELFAAMSTPAGAFCVPGNLDPLIWVKKATENTGVQVLCNEIVSVEVKDRRLLIAGLGGWLPGLNEKEIVRQLETAGGPGDIRIILSHRPDIVLHLSKDSPVDLVVSGHTHGGQARLPWIGALAMSSHIPRKAAGGGLSQVNGHALYVNRGVGVERSQAPSFRFLCPPTVSILTLTGPANALEAMAETAPGE
jgi:predicted MPP superfamily phosphohydrolase